MCAVLTRLTFSLDLSLNERGLRLESMRLSTQKLFDDGALFF